VLFPPTHGIHASPSSECGTQDSWCPPVLFQGVFINGSDCFPDIFITVTLIVPCINNTHKVLATTWRGLKTQVSLAYMSLMVIPWVSNLTPAGQVSFGVTVLLSNQEEAQVPPDDGTVERDYT